MREREREWYQILDRGCLKVAELTDATNNAHNQLQVGKEKHLHFMGELEKKAEAFC